MEQVVNINEYVVIDEYVKKESPSKSSSESIVSQSIDSPRNNNAFSICDMFYTDPIFEPIIAKLNKNMHSERIKKKINDILSALIGKQKIDFETLKSLTFQGIPDEFPAVRSLIWKLMMNYLPNNIFEWNKYLIDKHLEYENIKLDHIENLEIDNKNRDSKDNVLDEVIKDVKRTRTHMHFFLAPSKKNPNETNADVLTRILYIFSKIHVDVSYVQGMNEILAPIFYCFSNDPNTFFSNNIECDVFYCFENFMLNVKEIFLIEKDQSKEGVHFKIHIINKLLEVYDNQLYLHLQKQQIELHFFVFRWFTLFFTQEFTMPDILRLWDSIIIQKDKFEFMSYLCLAIITNNRTLLLKKDFSNIMLVMQKLDLLEINIEELIRSAIIIKDKLDAVK